MEGLSPAGLIKSHPLEAECFLWLTTGAEVRKIQSTRRTCSTIAGFKDGETRTGGHHLTAEQPQTNNQQGDGISALLPQGTEIRQQAE